MLLSIDKQGRLPVYRQVCEQIMALIDEGSLTAGAHLPATRALAGRLGLNRSTVYRAYQELWALGYLESRPGSYSTVRGRVRPAHSRPGAPAVIDWAAALPPESRRVREDVRHLPRPAAAPDVINFAGLAADRALAPLDSLKRAVRGVLAERGRDLLDYGDAAGYPPLREMVARRMRVHGVSVSAGEVLITNGAQHALDLIIRLLARPGASVAVELPTYALALPLLRLAGVEARAVPMRPDGADLDVLERTFAARRPAFFYTIPNFHNPTGITTGQAHRERLLALAERHRVPLVEDGFEEEMKYFGKAVLPIKSMDAHGVVIYVGTFSKVVFPGLRVGWIAAAPECIEALAAINRVCSLSGNSLGQAALERFCASGGYEAHLRRIHKAYRRRMQAMLAGLAEHMPRAGVHWTQPAGGYTLWVSLPGRDAGEEAAVVERLARAGVLVSPGRMYFPGEPDGAHFRLSVSNLTEARIVEGCRRLGRVLAELVGG